MQEVERNAKALQSAESLEYAQVNPCPLGSVHDLYPARAGRRSLVASGAANGG
ncbi:hypothetical protein D3OALGA1CA_5119 [Olavius algarvensis associated proteobacterium Delta 3]|nr:hypothetical protein D3OALGB2SA_3762 [Olavius algarvensis associated proteobacterium Delta 3]CAB5162097.1 hypothetical protein D3OALGA1CA_5119 [Olavius algarvensis associated proteobacterium Delta 3]